MGLAALAMLLKAVPGVANAFFNLAAGDVHIRPGLGPAQWRTLHPLQI